MIKGLVLAATAAIGIAGAADASSYQAPFGTFEVDFKMTDAEIYCYFDCPENSINPRPLAGLGVGDVGRGTLTISNVGRIDQIKVDASWAGGVIADGWGLYDIGKGRFWNTWQQEIKFTNVTGLISGFLMTTVFSSQLSGYDDVEEIYTIEFAQVAPVPLPASAALLPLGMGALAMMRKRRKRVS